VSSENKTEYKYPMWFKSKYSKLVVRFDGINWGEVIVGDEIYNKGYYISQEKTKTFGSWGNHTDEKSWIKTSKYGCEFTLLEILRKNRIFKIETADEFFGEQGRYTEEDMIKYDFSDKEKEQWRKCDFVITEKCDGYYNFPLTRQDIIELGEEITALGI
jgi:hypothetical protein